MFQEITHRGSLLGKDFVSNEFFKQIMAFEHNLGFVFGAVINDTPGEREVLHMQLTIPKTFIRFVCRGDNPLDNFRIKNWKDRLADWYKNGLQECFFFLHPQNEETAIDFAKFVQQELNGLVT